MKLRYYIKNNEKIYTLKAESNSQPTKDAHYNFIKIRDTVPKTQDL